MVRAPHWLQRARILGVGMLAALLAACASPPAPVPPPMAPTRTNAAVLAAVPPTAASAAVRAHYVKIQADLLATGLLRSDGGGQDTPFTARMLAENFIQIALYDEYTRGPTGPVQRQATSTLRKWDAPVRVGLRFGPSVAPDSRATDTVRIGSYLARLSRLTGHPIGLSDASPNFFVYIVSEDERRALGPTVIAALPGLSGSEVAGVTDMPLSTYCLVYALSDGASGRYTRAFAVIRAEHPDLLRLSCIHEEIAQGLGLANDSPRARPSIFNDDEEFALLTRQDELMLRILYNPALRPGMSEAEARPLIQSLAEALIGGDS